MKADQDTREMMVLQSEARRMRACAERVNLIVRAMTLRRGLAVGPREVTQEDIDQNA